MDSVPEHIRSFELMLDRMPIACVMNDAQFRFTYWNPAAERTFGFSLDEILGKHPFDTITPPRSQALVQSLFERLKRGDMTANGVGENLRRDGRIILCDWINTPLHLADGTFIGIMSMCQDITEKFEAEKALKESEARNSALLNALPDTVLLQNSQGEILECYSGAPDSAVFSPSRIVGKNISALTSTEEEKHAFVQAQQKALVESRPQNVEFRVYHNGNQFDFEARIVSFDKDRTLAVLRDVTVRKRAEDQLAESEHRLELAVAGANLGLWDWNYKTNTTFYSERWGAMLGYRPDEIEHTVEFWERLVHPEDRPSVIKDLQDHLEGRTKVFQCMHRIRAKSGEWKWILSSGKVVERDRNGTPIRVVGTYLDFTERRNLQDQLLQAQKMESVGRLAGGVAHDFNNLLTIVSGHTSFLMDKMGPESPYYRQLEKVSRAAERAAELTRRLLAFSRQRILTSAIVNLNEVVEEGEDMLRPLIGEDIALEVEKDPHLGSIKADSGQIMQIIMNLAVNARDAMPEGGILRIRTSRVQIPKTKGGPDISPGSYAQLTIEDTGMGMSPEVLSHIFEPFFTTKNQDEGTGLGLSIVYGIVKQSGGHIRCESKLGEGTKFTVLFPVVNDETDSPSSEIMKADQNPGHERILLVEDEEGVRELVKDVLEIGGYQVQEAHNPSMALELLAQNPASVDMVVTDVVMPGMNGRDMIEQMLKIKPLLKYLFISGYTDKAIHRHGPMPANAFLQKPFTSDELRKKVRALLDQNLDESQNSLI